MGCRDGAARDGEGRPVRALLFAALLAAVLGAGLALAFGVALALHLPYPP